MEDQAQTAKAIFSVILLIVGFAVAGLLFTFTQVLGGQTYNLVEDDIESITSYSSTNHSFVALNNSWVDLGNTTLRHVVLYNITGWVVNTTDFDINVTTGYVLLNPDDHNSNLTLNGTTMQAVYEYDDETIKTAIQSGIISNFEAQQQIGNYMPIIALAIIITIVIGLIIGGIASRFMTPGMGFGGGGFGGGPGSYGGVL